MLAHICLVTLTRWHSPQSRARPPANAGVPQVLNPLLSVNLNRELAFLPDVELSNPHIALRTCLVQGRHLSHVPAFRLSRLGRLMA